MFYGKQNKGFTLIELLIVIAIIAILATVVTVALSSAREKGRVVRAVSDLKQINNALELYLLTNGTYPPFDHTEKDWSKPFISWPKNPWGGTYSWECWQHFELCDDDKPCRDDRYSISISVPDSIGSDILDKLDKLIDDGSPYFGNIVQVNPDQIEYKGMDQTVNTGNNCPLAHG